MLAGMLAFLFKVSNFITNHCLLLSLSKLNHCNHWSIFVGYFHFSFSISVFLFQYFSLKRICNKSKQRKMNKKTNSSKIHEKTKMKRKQKENKTIIVKFLHSLLLYARRQEWTWSVRILNLIYVKIKIQENRKLTIFYSDIIKL